MQFNPGNINKFLFVKLPAAWICGVRLAEISPTQAISKVRFRWINQNPFRSMYFAVQMMAAELPTGVLMMRAVKDTGIPISMLVASCQATFHKRALGKIRFTCREVDAINDAITRSVTTGEAITVSLTSIGTNEHGETVSTMVFEWTIKPKLNNR
jgi:hypothetical protein